MRVTLLVAIGLILPGCVMAPVHVKTLTVQPPSLMVARKVERPLFIVLDPAKVPDTVIIPEDELKEIQVYEVQEFVRRDLKLAMESFFTHVEVVDPSHPLPPAHVRADVKINKLGMRVSKVMNTHNASQVAAGIYGEMTWGFALRPVEAEEYLFSYAGASKGAYSLQQHFRSCACGHAARHDREGHSEGTAVASVRWFNGAAPKVSRQLIQRIQRASCLQVRSK
jgi:hypothetical protein